MHHILLMILVGHFHILIQGYYNIPQYILIKIMNITFRSHHNFSHWNMVMVKGFDRILIHLQIHPMIVAYTKRSKSHQFKASNYFAKAFLLPKFTQRTHSPCDNGYNVYESHNISSYTCFYSTEIFFFVKKTPRIRDLFMRRYRIILLPS
jgi:hypothetical protein